MPQFSYAINRYNCHIIHTILQNGYNYILNLRVRDGKTI